MDLPQSTPDNQGQQSDPAHLDNPADIEYSKPSKARFLFLLGFFGIFIFSWAGCAKLWEHRFQNNEDIKIPENTTYDPKYK